MSNDHPAAGPATPGSDNTFFDWMRGLGVPRQPGWIGGVCAGVAARLGIDPIIVRGILVVIGVLGGPVLLVYAAAWLLLPDHYDRIHLQEAIRGNFTRAHAGIGVMVLLSFLPLAQSRVWSPASWFDFSPIVGWLPGPLIWGLFWTAVIIAATIWFIVWLVNKSKDSGTLPGAPHGGVPYGSAPGTASYGAAPTYTATAGASDAASSDGPTVSDPADPAAPAGSAGVAAGDGFVWVAPAAEQPGAPSAPPSPAEGASDDELAAWKAQQATWRREHDEWKRQQAAGEREARQQRAAEERRIRQERSAELHRAHIEQQRRTRSNPIFSLVMIGLAICAGAVTALTIGDTGDATAAITGLSVTLAVLGLAIIINGFRGKRSGGSGGVAFLVVLALIVTTLFSWVSGPTAADDRRWAPAFSADSSPRMTVMSGDVTLDLTDFFDVDPGDREYQNARVDLFVGRGDVEVLVPADEFVAVDAYTVTGSIDFADPRRGSHHGPFVSGYEDFRPEKSRDRDVYVRVWVLSGDVSISTP